MSDAETTYLVSDDGGRTAVLSDADRAERLSRAGYAVTAVTRRAA